MQKNKMLAASFAAMLCLAFAMPANAEGEVERARAALEAKRAAEAKTPPAPAPAPAQASELVELTKKLAELTARLAAPAPTAPDGAACYKHVPCANAVAAAAAPIKERIRTITNTVVKTVKVQDPRMVKALRDAELKLARLEAELKSQLGLAQHNAAAAQAQQETIRSILAPVTHPHLAPYARCRGGFRLDVNVYTPGSARSTLSCDREVDLARVEKVDSKDAETRHLLAMRPPAPVPPAALPPPNGQEDQPKKKGGLSAGGWLASALIGAGLGAAGGCGVGGAYRPYQLDGDGNFSQSGCGYGALIGAPVGAALGVGVAAIIHYAKKK